MRISDWSSDVCSSDLIDPGAGLMRLSKDAVEEYGLDDYELVSASGAAMTAALERAVKRKEWIVVTGWSPHWMFGAHELRYLEDPKGVLGGQEHIDVIARKGFYQDHPEVGAFLEIGRASCRERVCQYV